MLRSTHSHRASIAAPRAGDPVDSATGRIRTSWGLCRERCAPRRHQQRTALTLTSHVERRATARSRRRVRKPTPASTSRIGAIASASSRDTPGALQPEALRLVRGASACPGTPLPPSRGSVTLPSGALPLPEAPAGFASGGGSVAASPFGVVPARVIQHTAAFHTTRNLNTDLCVASRAALSDC